jgi:RNase P subunit RPR2
MIPSRSCGNQLEDHQMKKTTCAACDCELGPETISVKLGGRIVEVCCEECAAALKEADAAATAATTGKN